MIGMVAWGDDGRGVAGGARIAAERPIGWNRQLRHHAAARHAATCVTKVLTGYVMALVSIVLLYARGHVARRAACRRSSWLEMTGLVLVGLIPFAVLGILSATCSRSTRWARRWAASIVALRPARRVVGPDRQTAPGSKGAQAAPVLLAHAGQPGRGQRRRRGPSRPGSCIAVWTAALVVLTAPGLRRATPSAV